MSLTNAIKSEPVVTHGTAAVIAAAVTPVLIAAGLSSTDAGRYGSLAGAALALILTVSHLWSARSKVTPILGAGGLAEVVSEAKAVLADLRAVKALPTPTPWPAPPGNPIPEPPAPTPLVDQ